MHVAAAGADNGDLNYGQIKAVRVIGNVEAINHTDQSVAPLHNDDLLYQGYSVRTAEDASIVLIFSNGACLRLGHNTELSIDEFLQNPFPEAELAVDKLTKEPSTSSTRLRLARGEIIGQVVKLQPGSSHTISTPVGAAGIRGTAFRHVFQRNAAGNAVFSSATDEGEVLFTSLDGQNTSIGAATEITGRSRVGRGANVRFTSHEITRRSKVVIDHHVNVIRTARPRVIFRRADGRMTAPGAKPVLRRDPAAQRDRDNDFKDIDREEQERVRQDQAKATRIPKEKTTKTPNTKTPAKKN
jgi:hypothetical protein